MQQNEHDEVVGGSLFHARGPATANDRSLNDGVVRGTATAQDADLRPALPVAAADVVIRSSKKTTMPLHVHC